MRRGAAGPSGILLILLAAFALGVEDVARLHAQSTPPPNPVQRAQALVQRQQFDSALTVLDSLTASNPAAPAGWVLTAIARHGKKDYVGALEANERALAINPALPTPLYNGGLELGLLGRLDEAFEWLVRAKATNAIVMDQLRVDPDAVPLRGDPRYAALLPSAEEYADPFVEPVKILAEWVGEGAGGQFGWVARDIGDVDGDGVHDVTTSAPTLGPNNSGKVYAYSSATGALLWSQVGAPGSQLGLGIEAAGDVNGDGVPDVAAGAPPASRTYVYGGRDGAVLLELSGEGPGDSFGRRVTDIGDVNGDGFDDLLVGAPNSAVGGQNSGRAYVFSGRDGATLLDLPGAGAGHLFGSSAAGRTDGGRTFLVVGAPGAGSGGRTYVYEGLDPTPAFVIDADPGGAQLGGMFVSVVGDVNADGVQDIYASDWSDGGAAPNIGKIYLHSGADGSRLFTLTGTTLGEGFGIGAADAGDLDGDGHADLAVGSWQYAGAAPSGGRVSLHSGADGSLMRVITGKVPGETFGFDATGVGDVDGDGTPDLLLTSAWSSIRGYRSGRMFIVSGAAGG